MRISSRKLKWGQTAARAVAVVLALRTSVLPASATLVAITNPAVTVTDNGTYTVGYDFSVGPQALVVSALGVWDADTNGLLIAHPVAIWTTTGTLLASNTVPAGTAGTLVGEYRYADLTSSLVLTAGATYRIGALTGTDDYHGSVFLPSANAPVFATPNVNFVNRIADLSGVFVFPNSLFLGGASAWDFPNFEYVLIPEPSTMLLLGLGGGLLWQRARRAHRLSSST